MNKTFTISAVAATALVGYAVWFDYQRRHSADFRKNLKKKAVSQKKKSEKAEAETKKNKIELLKKALTEDLAANPVPTDLSEKESFFMQQVALGEQLATKEETKIDAAICFYKALAVYPNPTDILGIYQRSVPEDVYELVVMMVAFKPPQSVANIVGDAPDTKPREDDLD
ncbi:predicted protein [Scheffersomyces stipitis CBS 6054]|uniref:Mitochondrial import receptor subunit TOM20 n=1 Tax=Scheffersomyces stipitis (strain ATCC 58785 / CBS 6054 / NBRC 10063 / NRRL Y-11545) TaxID=322104 RepID=A3LRA9_PICST|nr:predicted protein [Scheffersomyces stipitis CBS 6054]ABN65349.1 predicted protein [Scheffersomyces stipitis CBS 6054]KAG2733762.1 hypothetical protein G9P44_003287 [Scheffersomyces stipitis]